MDTNLNTNTSLEVVSDTGAESDANASTGIGIGTQTYPLNPQPDAPSVGNATTYAPANKRLSRSRTDSMLGGVCGGVAHYFSLDPTAVRLAFVLLVLLGFGTGLVIYLVMWLVVPLEGRDASVPLEQPASSGAGETSQRAQTGQQAGLLIGGVLLLVGLIFLAENLFGWWVPWLGMGTLWPLLLIVAGVALVLRRTREA